MPVTARDGRPPVIHFLPDADVVRRFNLAGADDDADIEHLHLQL